MRPAKLVVTTLLILILMVGVGGCAKERGCTDPAAVNYNPNAQVDNNTCRYSGSVIFWTASNSLGTITVNISNLQSTITSYLTGGVPTCGFTGCATFDLTPGTYAYTATSQSGANWNGDVTITINGCQPIQLQ